MDTTYTVSQAKIIDENDTLHIAINSCKVDVWQKCISFNTKVTNVIPISVTQLRNDDINIPSPANMQIHLKGIPYNILVSPDSDIAALADSFVAEHKLKAEIKPRIEIELLKTQVDSCVSYQNKLKKNNGQLRRQVLKTTFAETRAHTAEETCLKLVDSMSRIEAMVPSLRTVINQQKSDIEMYRDQLSHQSEKLSEYAEKVKLLEQYKSDIELLGKTPNKDHSINTPSDIPLSSKSPHESELEKLNLQVAKLRESLRHKDIELKNLADDIKNSKTQPAVTALVSEDVQKPVKELQRQLDFVKRRLSDCEHEKNSLQSKYSNLTLNNDVLLQSLNNKENDIIALQEKLKLQKNLDLTHQMLVDENSTLKSHVVSLRGEVLSLQSQIEELKTSALNVIKTMQSSNEKVITADSPNNTYNASNTTVHSDDGHSRHGVSSTSFQSATYEPNDGEIVVDLMEVNDTDGKSDEDPQSEATVAEVDLALQQLITNLKLNEKSVASLSPIVEDRFLQNIFSYYREENNNMLSLTR